MADGKNDNFLFGVINRVNHAVITRTNPPAFASGKFHHAGRTWIGAGDYRVIYTINDAKKEVVIFAIGHRREIYR